MFVLPWSPQKLYGYLAATATTQILFYILYNAHSKYFILTKKHHIFWLPILLAIIPPWYVLSSLCCQVISLTIRKALFSDLIQMQRAATG